MRWRSAAILLNRKYWLTRSRIRAHRPECEFTAITEADRASDDRRHQFITHLFADANIALVLLSRIERFAEDLRLRLQRSL
jgi:hypothetical protein